MTEMTVKLLLQALNGVPEDTVVYVGRTPITTICHWNPKDNSFRLDADT